jgi:hypothetical protein
MEMLSLDEARRQLTRQVLGAKTLAEIAVARQTLRDWIGAHPEEHGMRWGFEQLAQMQEIAEMEEATSAVQPQATSIT